MLSLTSNVVSSLELDELDDDSSLVDEDDCSFVDEDEDEDECVSV